MSTSTSLSLSLSLPTLSDCSSRWPIIIANHSSGRVRSEATALCRLSPIGQRQLRQYNPKTLRCMLWPCQCTQLLMELFSSCRMLRQLTDCCGTSLAAVSGMKTAVARDAELLLCNMAPPIRVGDYVACGMFLNV